MAATLGAGQLVSTVRCQLDDGRENSVTYKIRIIERKVNINPSKIGRMLNQVLGVTNREPRIAGLFGEIYSRCAERLALSPFATSVQVSASYWYGEIRTLPKL